MTENEIKQVDMSEYICTALALKNKPSIKEIAEELKTTQKKVCEIIKADNLYYRAAWLKYDKAIFETDEALKKVKKRRLLAEAELEKELKNIEEGKQGRTYSV